MKRIFAYIAILAMLILAPVQKLDVAELEPVEVVYLYKESDQITLLTDTKAQGSGGNVQSALQDLKETTPGVVYLDTARYLLVSHNTLDQIDALRPELKGRTRICMAENVELEAAAKYLHVHGKLPILRQWQKGQKLPFWDGEKIFHKT